MTRGPFAVRLDEVIYTGCTATVTGNVPSNCSSFQINLQGNNHLNIDGLERDCEIALQISFSFEDGDEYVEMNALNYEEGWIHSDERTEAPFQKGSNFEIKIECTSNSFNVWSSSQFLFGLEHSVQVERMHYIAIVGNVIITAIHIDSPGRGTRTLMGPEPQPMAALPSPVMTPPPQMMTPPPTMMGAPPMMAPPPMVVGAPMMMAPPPTPIIVYPPMGPHPMGPHPMGPPLMGPPPMGLPPMGAPPMGSPPMGPPPMGAPPMGSPPMGPPPMGHPSSGYPPMGYPPMGYPPMGYPPTGSPLMGHTPMGYPPMGTPPMGHTPMGYAAMEPPSLGQSPSGRSPMGQSSMGQPPIGHYPTEHSPTELGREGQQKNGCCVLL